MKDLFLRALGQLGILCIIALFVGRSDEVLIKAWWQGGKSRIDEKVRTDAKSGRAAVESELLECRARHPEACTDPSV